MNCCALASCEHALIALRWLAGGMRNVLFHLQNKEMVQRKKNLNWAGFRNWGMPAWMWRGGRCRTLWARAGHAAQKERQRKFPMKAMNKYLGTHYLCVLWPQDSVEVKHVSYFPSRPPPSLPQSQPITSNLSAAKSRWLRPAGSPLGSRLACNTGTNQNSIKFYHEKG